jgi:hypothetical protein
LAETTWAAASLLRSFGRWRDCRRDAKTPNLRTDFKVIRANMPRCARSCSSASSPPTFASRGSVPSAEAGRLRLRHGSEGGICDGGVQRVKPILGVRHVDASVGRHGPHSCRRLARPSLSAIQLVVLPCTGRRTWAVTPCPPVPRYRLVWRSSVSPKPNRFHAEITEGANLSTEDGRNPKWPVGLVPLDLWGP